MQSGRRRSRWRTWHLSPEWSCDVINNTITRYKRPAKSSTCECECCCDNVFMLASHCIVFGYIFCWSWCLSWGRGRLFQMRNNNLKLRSECYYAKIDSTSYTHYMYVPTPTHNKTPNSNSSSMFHVPTNTSLIPLIYFQHRNRANCKSLPKSHKPNSTDKVNKVAL